MPGVSHRPGLAGRMHPGPLSHPVFGYFSDAEDKSPRTIRLLRPGASAGRYPDRSSRRHGTSTYPRSVTRPLRCCRSKDGRRHPGGRHRGLAGPLGRRDPRGGVSAAVPTHPRGLGDGRAAAEASGNGCPGADPPRSTPRHPGPGSAPGRLTGLPHSSEARHVRWVTLKPGAGCARRTRNDFDGRDTDDRGTRGIWSGS